MYNCLWVPFLAAPHASVTTAILLGLFFVLASPSEFHQDHLAKAIGFDAVDWMAVGLDLSAEDWVLSCVRTGLIFMWPVYGGLDVGRFNLDVATKLDFLALLN